MNGEKCYVRQYPYLSDLVWDMHDNDVASIELISHKEEFWEDGCKYACETTVTITPSGNAYRVQFTYLDCTKLFFADSVFVQGKKITFCREDYKVDFSIEYAYLCDVYGHVLGEFKDE